MLKKSVMLAAALLLFGSSIFVAAGYYDDYDERVLVDNKCKCVKVTSKFVPSKENPNENVLERNIEIRIPLTARMNISDPTSPLRTNFVYDLSKLCKNCNPTKIELGGESIWASQGTCTSDSEDTCYTYNRNKCYTWGVPFSYNGKTVVKRVALNPESCYE
ncbi:immunoglobulin J chain [Pelobates fuscus]|uniref:immunoglobulin J chain n=1 Tax=Pelobates fuscus TaxID=191477 RepID=UPI002FE4A1A7